MPRKIVIVGASGSVGTAVVGALSARAGEEKDLTIIAGVRDPHASKSAGLHKPGVELAVCDMNDVKSMEKEFKGADSVFINTPGDENRTALANAAIDAAKTSGVAHVVIVSVASADHKETIFGKQFNAIEAHLKSSGLRYTIARLPMFFENLWGQQGAIKGQSAIYSNVTGSKQWASIAVQDAGTAIAQILLHPDHYHNTTFKNRTFNFNSHTTSYTELAHLFSEELKKTVTYHQVSTEHTKQALLGMGIPEWQADGILELNAFCEKEDPVFHVHHPDFFTVTSKQPMTALHWVKSVAPAFQ